MADRSLSLSEMPSWQALDKPDKSEVHAPRKMGASSTVRSATGGRALAKASPGRVKSATSRAAAHPRRFPRHY
jgi:hypothetical protein